MKALRTGTSVACAALLQRAAECQAAGQTAAQGLEPMLSVTRAWRLVKFVDNGMLTMTKCTKCGGHYVTHPHEIAKHFVCGLCNPPARAGKGRQAGALQMPSAASRQPAMLDAD